MKSKTISSLAGLMLVGLFFTACDAEVACTEEFISVGIGISDGTPDDFYTLRESTGDTIRFESEPSDSFYTVVDDSWQEELEGEEETFIFEAVVDGTVVISERYVIGADLCHIYKVSGATDGTLN